MHCRAIYIFLVFGQGYQMSNNLRALGMGSSCSTKGVRDGNLSESRNLACSSLTNFFTAHTEKDAQFSSSMLVSFVSAASELKNNAQQAALSALVSALLVYCDRGWRLALFLHVFHRDPFHAFVRNHSGLNGAYAVSCQRNGGFVLIVEKYQQKIKFGLMSRYRSTWKKYVDVVEWFLITEDDLLWNNDHLDLMIESYSVLDRTPYVPGLMRYEIREEICSCYL